MRYLGMSLGMGVALGYCAAFGTLVPPLLKGLFPDIPVEETLTQIAATLSGRLTLAGVAISLLGIAVCALAGFAKERELPDQDKTRAIAEFSFKKGIIVATFSGIMSACFAFALTAGTPINTASIAAGTSPLWAGLPKLVIVLSGGFTTNFIWCLALNIKNKTGYQYLAKRARPEHAVCASVPDMHNKGADAPSGLPVQVSASDLEIPWLANYFWCAIAGCTWYLQFFFYTMGETQMGKYGFASWSLHMASIIIFSTAWGWYFREWKGASRKVHSLIAIGIVTLILSTMVIGYGSYLKGLR
jgi:L-rhamnose-H+ transport protein